MRFEEWSDLLRLGAFIVRLKTQHVESHGSECLKMPRRVSRELPREVDLAPAYPGYFLVRREYIQKIRADPRDTCRRTFSAEFEIRRELRGRRRRWQRFDDRLVVPKPAKNKFGRWQLEVLNH